MKLFCIGDIHGDVQLLEQALEQIRLETASAVLSPVDYAIIQVGDLTAHEMNSDQVGALFRKYHVHSMMWIDGNHDDLTHLKRSSDPSPGHVVPLSMSISRRLVYLERGIVYALNDGNRVLTLGGGESVAPYSCLGWHPLEAISSYQADYAKNHSRVDVMVTHVPPAWIIEKYLNVKPSTSSLFVQDVWEHYNNPPLICGHIHRSVSDSGVRVLDKGEVYVHDFGATSTEILVSETEQSNMIMPSHVSDLLQAYSHIID